MHLKRQKSNRKWPIPRKGTKYVIMPSHEKNNGMPILIVLREILKLAKTSREARRILATGTVSINNRVVRRENYPVLLFDNFKIGEKNYTLGLSNTGKFSVSESKKNEKILKVIGKKMIGKGRIQINLMHGENVVSDKKVKTGDSIILKEGKIAEILPLERGRKVSVFAGKNAGKDGKIENIEGNTVLIDCKEGKHRALIKNILVTA